MTTTDPTPDPTHGRIDRDIQAKVDDWGPRDVGQRTAVENTLQAQRAARRPAAPAEPAGDSPAATDPHPGTPDGAAGVLGRAWLGTSGLLWTNQHHAPTPDAREVLLVSPAAGRVLDAAREVASVRSLGDARDWRRVAALHRELRAAVDALDADQPAESAPPDDAWCCETCRRISAAAAPEPDDGLGYSRHADDEREQIAENRRLGVYAQDIAYAVVHLTNAGHPGLGAAVTKLLAHADRLAVQHEHCAWGGCRPDCEQALSGARAELAEATIDRDRLRAERDSLQRHLAEATAEVERLNRRDGVLIVKSDPEEPSTARRDAAAVLTTIDTWAAGFRAGTRTLPGTQPADTEGDQDG